ncbi:MAG: putative bifunctional diguanylate cyclase/phosphodiesterase, partial [Mycobacteriales bacterium]
MSGASAATQGWAVELLGPEPQPLSERVLGRPDAHPQVRAALLASALFFAYAFTVALATPFLPGVHTAVLEATALGIGLVGGALRALPFGRWRAWTTLLPPILGMLALGPALGFYGHALLYFLPFIGLAAYYAGATQPPGVTLALAPVTLALGWLGTLAPGEGPLLIPLVVAVAVGVVAGESLAQQRLRSAQLAGRQQGLLTHVDRLICATSIAEVATRLIEATDHLLRAELFAVTVATHEDPGAFAVVAGRGIPAEQHHLVLDSRGASGMAEAVRRRRPVFVGDVRGTDLVHRQILARARARSALWLPLLTEGGAPIGVLLVGWRHVQGAPNAQDGPALEQLARTAGRLLANLLRESRLAVHSRTDSLTGLGNRRDFDSWPDVLEEGDALVLLDLDHFKALNDTLGHLEGDRELAAAAATLRTVLRASDRAARFGGDDIVVLATGAGQAGAQALAERLRTTWRARGRTTLSLGIAVAAAGQSTRGVLEQADAALYRAKADGRDQVRLHTMANADPMVALIQAGLDGDGIEVAYQPIWHLRERRLSGVEALARLRAPDGGLIAPDVFVPVAESAGLITALGTRVLDLATTQAAAWQRRRAPGLRISVNVAAQQVAAPGFLSSVESAVHRSGIAPQTLRLELTESALLDASPTVVTLLADLTNRGIHVGVDDFGTGWASLRYVHRLPITFLKIDKEFVAGLPDSVASRAIVRSVTTLAGELGLKCVAEGIETPEQLEFLTKLGCLGQGYLLGCPMPPEMLERTLDRPMPDSPATRLPDLPR